MIENYLINFMIFPFSRFFLSSPFLLFFFFFFPSVFFFLFLLFNPLFQLEITPIERKVPIVMEFFPSVFFFLFLPFNPLFHLEIMPLERKVPIVMESSTPKPPHPPELLQTVKMGRQIICGKKVLTISKVTERMFERIPNYENFRSYALFQ